MGILIEKKGLCTVYVECNMAPPTHSKRSKKNKKKKNNVYNKLYNNSVSITTFFCS